MPNWTKEQVSAIHESNSNIIVSAGAGSGKTAVLSERVLTKLKSGVSLKNLVILTFTNLAASEMKERIEKKLKECINEYPLLNKELEYVDQAIITTFDAYALFLVKKYSVYLNIDKNISIADNIVLEIELDKIIDDVFNERYSLKNKKFIKLIEDYTVKDDTAIKKNINDFYKSINNFLNKSEYLDTYIDKYYNDEEIDKNISEYISLIFNEINNIKSCMCCLNECLKEQKEIDYLEKLRIYLQDLLSSKNYNQIKEAVFLLDKFPIIQKPSVILLNKKDEIKLSIDKIKKLTKYDNVDEMRKNITDTKEYVQEIIEILKIIFERMKQYKKDNNLYEFIDIAELGIKLLKENNDIRLEIKNSINEIMIDEYQDTNDIQDVFISLISNNNVYMVGDVKQSIYRFRNANPKIFMKKYKDYESNIGGIKIDLIKNFRSRSEVLNNINEIFDYVMDDNIGGADYKKSHRLVFGFEPYNDYNKENYNMSIYNYENVKNNKNEVEAFIIARDIKKKIEESYQIYDTDKKIIRSCTYGDFAILIDRSSQFELYRKVFEYMNIPLCINKSDSFIHSDEMYVILNILKIIYSYKNNEYKIDNLKHSMMSVLRSFLFNYSDDQIANLIINNDIITEIAKEESIFNNIYNVTKEISNHLELMTIDEVLDEVYNKFNMKQKVSKIGNYNNTITKLNYLLNKAKELSEIGYNLIDFINYIEYTILDKDKDIDYKCIDKAETSVSIMTIHASKGLEFNICYFPEMYREFSKNDIQKQYIFSKSRGIIVPHIKDYIIDNTIYNELEKNDYKKEEIGERLRLLYVGLTRAKQKVIILIPDFYNEEHTIYDMVPNEERMKYNSFRSVILSVQNKINKYVYDIIDTTIDEKYKQNQEIKNLQNNSNETIRYINIDINSEKINNESYSKKVYELTSKETKNNMEYGTKVHKYLELMDVNDNKIVQDFKNTLKTIGININDSIKYNEYEFMYEEDKKIKHGIIDLLIEDKKMYIIDYKLKNIDSKEYKMQLEGYKKYIKLKTNKEVECYLYSILNNTLEKII